MIDDLLSKKLSFFIILILTSSSLGIGGHSMYSTAQGNQITLDTVTSEINQHKSELIPHIGNDIIDNQLQKDVSDIYNILNIMQEDIYDIKIIICSHSEFVCN